MIPDHFQDAVRPVWGIDRKQVGRQMQKSNQEETKVKEYGVNELRRMFLEFFESKDHLKMKSFSLVPRNDKSLRSEERRVGKECL